MLYDFIKETNKISVLYYKADHPYLLALKCLLYTVSATNIYLHWREPQLAQVQHKEIDFGLLLYLMHIMWKKNEGWIICLFKIKLLQINLVSIL